MERRSRSSIGLGLILILAGALLLAIRLVPEFGAWMEANFAWPFYLIGFGAALLIWGLTSGATGLLVPASIVAGIGGLLYWQTVTGNFSSWAYAWSLIPGFVGFGILLMGLLDPGKRDQIQASGWLMLISVILFFIFGSIFGGADLLGPYWPILLIGLGLLLLAQSARSRDKSES
ncbi:MAG: hypothetical protein ACLFWD_03935 [Anaerolineales bacterium]